MIESDQKEFLKIILRDKPLHECELVWSDGGQPYDDSRLYILRSEDKAGFYAHAVNFVSCCGGADDYWSHESLVVSTVFEVTACWDGVRHLEFNRNEDCPMSGYLYYQSMPELIAMLQKVREIELECCREPS